MPQLVRGGKYVYGMSRIGSNGKIVIPPEAMREYRYKDGDYVILMSGSRKSGGFGLTQKKILEKSELNTILKQLPALADYKIPETEIIEQGGRLFCWTVIRDGGRITLPIQTLADYGLKPGDLLAVGRGSYISIAFIARGPIHDESMRHPELEVFED
ncbi:MAG: hypothetical protein JXA51_02315 [Dehalococcoidales bacterium]|nr:hypothetical protein [Dehalococcoidales bacterium]